MRILGTGSAVPAFTLENAGLTAADVDYILCSTVQADTVTPSLACLLQKELGVAPLQAYIRYEITTQWAVGGHNL